MAEKDEVVGSEQTDESEFEFSFPWEWLGEAQLRSKEGSPLSTTVCFSRVYIHDWDLLRQGEQKEEAEEETEEEQSAVKDLVVAASELGLKEVGEMGDKTEEASLAAEVSSGAVDGLLQEAGEDMAALGLPSSFGWAGETKESEKSADGKKKKKKKQAEEESERETASGVSEEKSSLSVEEEWSRYWERFGAYLCSKSWAADYWSELEPGMKLDVVSVLEGTEKDGLLPQHALQEVRGEEKSGTPTSTTESKAESAPSKEEWEKRWTTCMETTYKKTCSDFYAARETKDVTADFVMERCKASMKRLRGQLREFGFLLGHDKLSRFVS